MPQSAPESICTPLIKRKTAVNGEKEHLSRAEHVGNVTVTQTPSHGLRLLQEKQVAATVVGAAEHKHVRARERYFKC